MKTSKGKTIAVIKNGHTAAEMREIEREFIHAETVKCTIEELIKFESERHAKAKSHS